MTAAIILSISLQAVALLAGVAWKRIKARREGRIALPLSPEEEAAAYRAEAERSARAATVSGSVTANEVPPQPANKQTNKVVDVVDEEVAAESSGATVTPTKVTRKLGGSSSKK